MKLLDCMRECLRLGRDELGKEKDQNRRQLLRVLIFSLEELVTYYTKQASAGSKS